MRIGLMRYRVVAIELGRQMLNYWLIIHVIDDDIYLKRGRPMFLFLVEYQRSPMSENRCRPHYK